MIRLIALILLLLPALWLNFEATQESFQNSKPYQRYAAAAAWFKANTPPGSRIYQTDWDDFGPLFFYNSQNSYTLGLDPTYMQLYNADLYDLWVAISRGWVTVPSQVITATFGANYILTDIDHESFLLNARADPYLEEVHRDDYTIIFRVRDQTGSSQSKE